MSEQDNKPVQPVAEPVVKVDDVAAPVVAELPEGAEWVKPAGIPAASGEFTELLRPPEPGSFEWQEAPPLDPPLDAVDDLPTDMQ